MCPRPWIQSSALEGLRGGRRRRKGGEEVGEEQVEEKDEEEEAEEEEEDNHNSPQSVVHQIHTAFSVDCGCAEALVWTPPIL